MTQLTKQVVNSLESLKSAFLQNELAYLALTQKVEHAFRDKLAFELHNRLKGDKESLVCREWCRTDLAVIRDSQPLLLLEAKAIYTFDIMKGGSQHPFPSQLQEDIEKSKVWQSDGKNSTLEILALLIATHPHDPPSAAYREAVKYYGGVVKYATEGITLEAASEQVHQRVQLPLVHQGVVAGGQAFGIDVSVAYWLFSGSLGVSN